MNTSPNLNPGRPSPQDRRQTERRRSAVAALSVRDEPVSSRGFSLTAPRSLGLVPAGTDSLIVFFSLVAVVYSYMMPWRDLYLPPAVLAAVFYPVAAAVLGIYSDWKNRTFMLRHLRIVSAWMLVMAFLLILAYGEKDSSLYSRRIMLTWLGIVPVLLLVADVFRQPLLRWLKGRTNSRPERVAVFGANGLADRLVKALSERTDGVEFIGYYDDRQKEEVFAGGEIQGGFKQLLEAVGSGSVNSVYIVLPMRAEMRIRELLERLSDTTATVQWVPDLFAFRLLHSELSVLAGIPVIGLCQTPFREFNAALKRMEDLILASLILLVSAVPMAVIAIAIRLSSSGSVLFRQRRFGMDGESIEVLKFRTMNVEENDPHSIQQVCRNDPRVTRLGSLLRKTSLDELPQFFNVLGGTMSVVGPRPHAVAHNEQYRRLIGGYMWRHKVKPGITGWAQINGFRGEINDLKDMQQRIRYDLDYIDNWSLLFDLYIVALTIFKGFHNKNAY